jgi:NADPH:quinone reductase
MQMQALCADEVGDWRTVLQWHKVACPAGQSLDPGESAAVMLNKEHDVLIRVEFCDLNPVDLQKLAQKRAVTTTASVPFIPGFSGSGVVLAMGSSSSCNSSNSHNITIGANVVFLTATGGAFAEYIVVDVRAVAVIPTTISLAQASVVPLAGCTAYEALVKLGLDSSAAAAAAASANEMATTITVPPTKQQRRLLIVGGAGGVGSWATVLAKAWWGDDLHIICTASSSSSVEWCRNQGADQVLGHDELVQQLGGGPQGSVDAILCLTEPTPSLMKGMSEVIRPYGNLCLVVAGPSIQNLDAGFVFFKCANITTETVFTSFRTNFVHGTSPGEKMTEILNLVAQGKVTAPLSNNPCNMKDWKLALENGGVLEALASGHTQGKLCMRIASSSCHE